MRRVPFLAVIAMVLVVAAMGPAASAAPPDQWLQNGHDAEHTFANLGETQLTAAALEQAGALDMATIDVGLEDVSSPLIQGDSMFVTSTSPNSEISPLERFDIATGQRVWSHDLTCFFGPFVTTGSLVIQDSCSESNPGTAQVLSTADGSLRYRAVAQPGFVHAGVAYLTNYGAPPYFEPWLVAAQNVATGRVLWKRFSASYQDAMLPVLASGHTLYVQHGPAVEAWDTATGDLIWSRTPTDKLSPLAATSNALYLRWQNGSDHGLVQWGASDGVTHWRIKTRATDPAFVFTPSMVYQVGAHFLSERWAVTGHLQWKWIGGPWKGLGQPVYAAGVLWAFQGGTLHAFDARYGSLLLSTSLPTSGQITVADGRVFVGSTDGRVFILSPPA